MSANKEMKLSNTVILIGQVAWLALEEILDSQGGVKYSELRETMLSKREVYRKQFKDEKFAFEISNQAGQERWYSMLGFAGTTLKKCGLRSGKRRGYWEITEEGEKFLKTHEDKKEKGEHKLALMYRDVAKKSQQDRKVQHGEGVSFSKTGEEVANKVQFGEDDIYSSIYDYLETLSPYEFQDLTGYLFQGMGYVISYVSEPGPDGGIDIIAHKDAIGIEGKIIKIQVKHSQDRNNAGVGMEEVERLRGLCSDKSVGVLVSLRGFTKEVQKRVRTGDSNTSIVLIDNVRFVELWIEHIDSIPEEGKGLLPLKEVYIIEQ